MGGGLRAAPAYDERPGLTVEPAAAGMSDISALKVAIVEDQPRVRESLRILIGCTDGFRCTGAFESMEDALVKIGRDLL
jgi:hypothetical protein